MSTFDKAFEVVIGHEGGYVNHPADRGGGTKYGVSKRAYPNLDIASLTLDDAKAIYKRDYWDKVRGDEMPYHVALQLFDAAVNHGVYQGTLFMQRALKVEADGVIGPLTLAAAQAEAEGAFVRRFNAARIRFFTGMNDVQWATFGKGWLNRVAANLES